LAQRHAGGVQGRLKPCDRKRLVLRESGTLVRSTRLPDQKGAAFQQPLPVKFFRDEIQPRRQSS
jgi:hypothetical protein